MSAIEIIAYGRPAPQGSKRHVGNGVMIESSKRCRPWRQDVKAAAEAAIACDCGCRSVIAECPLDGPLVVRMVVTVPKPKSAPKRKRTWPDRMPDLSKLARSTEDALTDAGVWKDDARVVEYERLAKVYPGEDPESLDAPGVRITIWRRDEREPWMYPRGEATPDDSTALAPWEEPTEAARRDEAEVLGSLAGKLRGRFEPHIPKEATP